MSVRVRVVHLVEQRLLGWIVGLAGGAWSIAYLGLRAGPLEPLGISRWWMVGIVLSSWIGGTLLAWRRPSFLARAEVAGGVLRAGTLVLEADHELAVHVARGARGFSVAVSRRGQGVFLELESEGDARSLLGALGVPWPGRGEVTIDAPHRGVRFAQRLSAAAGVVSAMLYSVFVGGFGVHDLKGVFGFPALILGLVASVLYVFDAAMRQPLRPGARAAHSFGSSAVDAHARLHDTSPVRADDPVPAPAVARIRVLEPAGEEPRAWLERVDALGRGEGGYRGDAPAVEELVAILGDERAPAAARLASARLLAVRHHHPADALCSSIDDEALARRVRVVVAADPARAAEELEACAPLFEIEGRARQS